MLIVENRLHEKAAIKGTHIAYLNLDYCIMLYELCCKGIDHHWISRFCLSRCLLIGPSIIKKCASSSISILLWYPNGLCCSYFYLCKKGITWALDMVCILCALCQTILNDLHAQELPLIKMILFPSCQRCFQAENDHILKINTWFCNCNDVILCYDWDIIMDNTIHWKLIPFRSSKFWEFDWEWEWVINTE